MPTLTGGPDNDLIIGTDDIDTISGLAGNDELRGMDGADIIDGGSGDDLITGGLGADVMTGGTGVDRFRDTVAGLNGDRITDFLPGDRIQITDLTPQNANIGINGSAITFNGGSVTIDNLGPGRLIVRAIQTGGVEVRLQQIAKSDFNGDGKKRRPLAQRQRLVHELDGKCERQRRLRQQRREPLQCHSGPVAGRRDGRLQRRWPGRRRMAQYQRLVHELAVAGERHVQQQRRQRVGSRATSWKVDGVGDFNGDGRDDLIWRNDNGTFTTWLAQADGGFVSNDANSLTVLPTNWKVSDTGDFNGDGRDDIIWRRDDGAFTTWLSQPNGSFVSNDTNSWALVPTNWKVEGTGDFNGDGADDIVWRRDDGAFTTWLSTGNGSFVSNDANSWAVIPTTWQVVETGDYNGDGRDDILWRRSDGGFTNCCLPATAVSSATTSTPSRSSPTPGTFRGPIPTGRANGLRRGAITLPVSADT
jgi:hypothetical protein